MCEKMFLIPKKLKVDYSELSIMPKNNKLVYLFLYAQRGKKMTLDAMQVVLQISRRSLRQAITAILENKGE